MFFEFLHSGGRTLNLEDAHSEEWILLDLVEENHHTDELWIGVIFLIVFLLGCLLIQFLSCRSHRLLGFGLFAQLGNDRDWQSYQPIGWQY